MDDSKFSTRRNNLCDSLDQSPCRSQSKLSEDKVKLEEPNRFKIVILKNNHPEQDTESAVRNVQTNQAISTLNPISLMTGDSRSDCSSKHLQNMKHCKSNRIASIQTSDAASATDIYKINQLSQQHQFMLANKNTKQEISTQKRKKSQHRSFEHLKELYSKGQRKIELVPLDPIDRTKDATNKRKIQDQSEI